MHDNQLALVRRPHAIASHRALDAAALRCIVRGVFEWQATLVCTVLHCSVARCGRQMRHSSTGLLYSFWRAVQAGKEGCPAHDRRRPCTGLPSCTLADSQAHISLQTQPNVDAGARSLSAVGRAAASVWRQDPLPPPVPAYQRLVRRGRPCHRKLPTEQSHMSICTPSVGFPFCLASVALVRTRACLLFSLGIWLETLPFFLPRLHVCPVTGSGSFDCVLQKRGTWTSSEPPALQRASKVDSRSGRGEKNQHDQNVCESILSDHLPYFSPGLLAGSACASFSQPSFLATLLYYTRTS